MNLEDCIDQYLARTTRGRKQITKNSIASTVAAVKRHIGHISLSLLSHEDVEDCAENIITEVRATKKNPSSNTGHTSANKAIVLVRSVLRFAVKAGYVKTSVAEDVLPYSTNPPRQEVLSDEEIASVLAAINEEPDLVSRGFLLMLMYTGMRKSEVSNVRWRHVNSDNDVLLLPETKSGKQQQVPLSKSAVDLLNQLRAKAAADPDDYVFHSPGNPAKRRYDIRRLLGRVTKRAGITRKICPHDLRRTVGLTVSRKHGLHIASKVLRHSSVQITERAYAPIDSEMVRQGMDDLYS